MPSYSTVAPAHSSATSHTRHYHVPTEITDMIIHLLRKETRALAECSAVSRLFQCIAEPLLYAKLRGVLSLYKREASVILFRSLAASHRRSSYVKKLTLTIADEGPVFDYLHMPSLTLPNLATLTLNADDNDQGTLWLCSHPCAISFCEALVTQPNLRSLTVSGLAGILPHILFLPPSLSHLTLDRTFVISDVDDGIDFSTLKWKALQSLIVSYTVFDTPTRNLLSSHHIETLQNVEITVSSLDCPSDLHALVQACGSSVKTLDIKLVGIAAAALLELDEMNLGALTSLETFTLQFTRWPDVNIVKAFLNTISKSSPLTNMVLEAGNTLVEDDWYGVAGFESAIQRVMADTVHPINMFMLLTASTNMNDEAE